jgi:cytidylate kinase
VALASKLKNINWQDAETIAASIPMLSIHFTADKVWLNEADITESIRTEEMGRGASTVAVHPAVRSALVSLQHSFKKAPGLVADGRDMASVIFPDAKTKVFLTASAKIRAERRYKQLMSKGIPANMADILSDLQQRDERDRARSAAPLLKTEDAVLLETDNISIEEAVQAVIKAYQRP